MRKAKNPLRKFSRLQLMELLAQQEKEIERLRKELDEKEAELADRRIQIQEAGSIAEAALKINRVFEAAQLAADQYLENVRARRPINPYDQTYLDDLHDSNELNEASRL